MIDYVLLILFTPILICFFWFFELLLSSDSSKTAKRHLAFFMLFASFSFYGELIYFKELYMVYSITYFLIAVFSFAQIPALYLYFLSLTQQKIKLKTYLSHYTLPLLFGVCIAFFHNIFLSIEESSLFLKNYFHPETFDSKFKVVMLAELIMRNGFLVFSIIYFILIHKNVKKHFISLENFCANTEKSNLRWIRLHNLLFLIMTIFGGTLFNLKGQLQIYRFEIVLFTPTLLLCFVFWRIGHLGNRQKTIILPESKEKTKENYNVIPEELRNHLTKKINNAMEVDHLYLDPNLCLPELSKQIGTNRYYLSKIINLEYGCNFNEYVNQYRIKHAIQLIHNTSNDNLSEIAFQSGYSSYNSFSRNFIKITKTTPNKFVKTRKS